MKSEFSVFGKSLVRKDAVEKVRGEAKYVSDIQLPKMLHAKFLRSPHAHARITNIDTSEAERIPGVKCILTYQNVPRVHPKGKLGYLLDHTVHCSGEEVAAVAALTAEIAEESLKLIKVEYEVLPAIFEPEEAMKPNATLAHQEYGTNMYHGTERIKIPRLDEEGWLRLEIGDVEKAFAEADYVIDAEFGETPMQYNCSPMPRTVICEWTGEKLTCWADTQLPLWVWQDLASSLGVPQSNVRVIADYSVGGYGGKTPEKTAILAAIMAKKTGRPVKAAFSRAEDFIATHHRISYRNYHRIAVKNDGTMTAIYSKIIANWGKDTSAPFICQATALLDACNMLYRWRDSKAETCGVMTNILGYGAMNGFGDPEAIYCVERLVDMAAEKINMDPVQFRIKNCMRYGDRAMEYEQVLYGPIKWGILGSDLSGFPEMIEKCAERAQWEDKWKGWRTPVAIDGPKRRGIGIAIGMHHTSFWRSSATVKMNQDGSANVLSMAVEMGQGYATAIAQVVAETLGIRYEDVNPILADTGVTPAAIGNVASSGTSSPINAAKLAAEDVKRQLFEIAALRLNAPIGTLEAKDGHIWIKGMNEKISIANICLSSWQITGSANNPPVDSVRDEQTGQVIHAYAAAVTIAEVEVDIETGMVEILRITSGHDCGRAINPVIVENQIDLGLVMANGWVRTEKYVIDNRTGVLLTDNLLDYRLTTFLDLPPANDFQRFIVEKPSAWGPFGAKGMSETSMTALAPAVANAIYNAIGVRLYEGFLSPDILLRAIKRTKFAS
jgi:xanthine dehydrogenase molybdenum-binding subunit